MCLCLSIHVVGIMPLYLSAFLFVCLFVCLFVMMFVCLSICLFLRRYVFLLDKFVVLVCTSIWAFYLSFLISHGCSGVVAVFDSFYIRLFALRIFIIISCVCLSVCPNVCFVFMFVPVHV